MTSDLEAEPENGKTLVVYYLATGNTEEAANYIAAATNADAFALEPKQPYTAADLDWTDDKSRVVYEHDNPDAREVELAAVADGSPTTRTLFMAREGLSGETPVCFELQSA